jgi:hypothetical protein
MTTVCHTPLSIVHTSGYPNTESPKMDIPFIPQSIVNYPASDVSLVLVILKVEGE